MGGGAGLSVHGAFRVATERALFAMPETNIGLFPDVGASYFLSRLPGGLGAYIGLTGARLGAADLMYTGLATHFLPSDKLANLEAELQGCATADQVSATLLQLGSGARPEGDGDSPLSRARAEIDHCFAPSSVEEIESRLEQTESEFAAVTLGTMRKMSPLSLKVSLRLIREGGSLSLADCLQADFRTSQHCMQEGSDFFEGIRAALVDKDRNPKWGAASVSEVTREQVDAFFAPIGERELKISALAGFQSVQSKI